jgi:hypothetical protein
MIDLPRDENTVNVNISYDLFKMNTLLFKMRDTEKNNKQFEQINDPK